MQADTEHSNMLTNEYYNLSLWSFDLKIITITVCWWILTTIGSLSHKCNCTYFQIGGQSSGVDFLPFHSSSIITASFRSASTDWRNGQLELNMNKNDFMFFGRNSMEKQYKLTIFFEGLQDQRILVLGIYKAFEVGRASCQNDHSTFANLKSHRNIECKNNIIMVILCKPLFKHECNSGSHTVERISMNWRIGEVHRDHAWNEGILLLSIEKKIRNARLTANKLKRDLNELYKYLMYFWSCKRQKLFSTPWVDNQSIDLM